MDLAVISREMIKPSSPTPSHLRNLKLSLMDQYVSDASDVRLLLVYSAKGDARKFQNTNTVLKKSLSRVLTQFYPLAGRLKSVHSLDCNDKGIEYIEARVKAPQTLDQVLDCPKGEELNRLIPRQCDAAERIIAAQVTLFEACGGMTVGMTMSHIVGDGLSLARFARSWAAITRGENTVSPAPEFGFSSLLPPRDVPMRMYENQGAVPVLSKPIAKRFLFREPKIAALKARCADQRPTRVEVISALVFKCMVNATGPLSSKSIMLFMPINLRSKMTSLGLHSFGNLFVPAMTLGVQDEPIDGLLGKLRKMIKETDGVNFVLDYIQKQKQVDVSLVVVTSFCKFPFHEADFGWGAPTWATSFALNPINVTDATILLDAKEGDGIEAWVTLEEEAMNRFESQKEILDFACRSQMVGSAQSRM